MKKARNGRILRVSADCNTSSKEDNPRQNTGAAPIWGSQAKRGSRFTWNIPAIARIPPPICPAPRVYLSFSPLTSRPSVLVWGGQPQAASLVRGGTPRNAPRKNVPRLQCVVIGEGRPAQRFPPIPESRRPRQSPRHPLSNAVKVPLANRSPQTHPPRFSAHLTRPHPQFIVFLYDPARICPLTVIRKHIQRQCDDSRSFSLQPFYLFPLPAPRPPAEAPRPRKPLPPPPTSWSPPQPSPPQTRPQPPCRQSRLYPLPPKPIHLSRPPRQRRLRPQRQHPQRP